MKPNWPPATAGDIPLKDAVQVWRLQLPLEDLLAERLASHLIPDETARAARFRREEDRQRFIAGRGGLRVLLGAQLGLPPGEVPLVQLNSGKLRLAGHPKANVEFNVAHSGSVTLIALSLGAAVGVDVEAMRPLPDALQLAERFFSPAESAALVAAPAAERLTVFYQLWTRKESVLKATGAGIANGLATVEVTGGEPAAVRRIDGDPQAGAHWSLREFEPAPHHLGCVAVRQAEAAIVLHGFTPAAFS
jgi:4'-phosphopantetheinyl transferase